MKTYKQQITILKSQLNAYKGATDEMGAEISTLREVIKENNLVDPIILKTTMEKLEIALNALSSIQVIERTDRINSNNTTPKNIIETIAEEALLQVKERA